MEEIIRDVPEHPRRHHESVIKWRLLEHQCHCPGRSGFNEALTIKVIMLDGHTICMKK